MQPEPRVRVPSHVHARLFDGDLVILDLANGEYFALDPIGARMWEGLAAGQPIRAIAEGVVEQFDVGFDRALVDVRALVEQLVSRKLLVLEP
jgi:hypothetical protein